MMRDSKQADDLKNINNYVQIKPAKSVKRMSFINIRRNTFSFTRTCLMIVSAFLYCLLSKTSDNHNSVLLVEANSDANRLYEDLMMSYNRFVRPVQNDSDTLVVKLGLKLSQLIDVVSIVLVARRIWHPNSD